MFPPVKASNGGNALGFLLIRTRDNATSGTDTDIALTQELQCCTGVLSGMLAQFSTVFCSALADSFYRLGKFRSRITAMNSLQFDALKIRIPGIRIGTSQARNTCRNTIGAAKSLRL